MEQANPTGYKAITRRWVKICNSSLDALDFGGKLIQAGVVHRLSVERAMAERTQSAQLHILLNDVVKNGAPETFKQFLDIIGSDHSTKWLSDEIAGEL